MMKNNTRTHQDIPELTQEASQILHDLTFSFHVTTFGFTKSGTNPKGTPEPEPRSLPQATDERHRRAREGKAAAAARTLCVSLREALRWQRAELASVRQQAGGSAR